MATESWVGPGIMFSFVDLKGQSRVSIDTLMQWFDKEWIPGLLATGVIKLAWLYEAVNPDYDKQTVVVYKVSDLALVHAGKLKQVPRSSPSGIFPGEVDDHVEFESRIYSFVQLYQTAKQDEDLAPNILLAMMQPSPGGEVDLDEWYRSEHNEQMSHEPGWKRTTRYNLLFQHGNTRREAPQLSFLAIHEFNEPNRLGINVEPLQPMSAWTERVLKDVQAVDAGIYRKVKGYGEAAGMGA